MPAETKSVEMTICSTTMSVESTIRATCKQVAGASRAASTCSVREYCRFSQIMSSGSGAMRQSSGPAPRK
eukprot:1526719-Prymnesium_polylepis.2